MFTRLLKIAISQPVAGGGQCKFTGLALRGLFSIILIKNIEQCGFGIISDVSEKMGFGIIPIGKYPNEKWKEIISLD